MACPLQPQAAAQEIAEKLAKACTGGGFGFRVV